MSVLHSKTQYTAGLITTGLVLQTQRILERNAVGQSVEWHKNFTAPGSVLYRVDVALQAQRQVFRSLIS